jgi:hypothetical protein
MNIPYSPGASHPAMQAYVGSLINTLTTTSLLDILRTNNPSTNNIVMNSTVVEGVPLVVDTLNEPSSLEYAMPSYDAVQAFNNALATIHIKDWSLFA